MCRNPLNWYALKECILLSVKCTSILFFLKKCSCSLVGTSKHVCKFLLLESILYFQQEFAYFYQKYLRKTQDGDVTPRKHMYLPPPSRSSVSLNSLPTLQGKLLSSVLSFLDVFRSLTTIVCIQQLCHRSLNMSSSLRTFLVFLLLIKVKVANSSQ